MTDFASTTVPARVARVATDRPEAVALRAACGVLSFADLDARAATLAGALVAAGVRPGGLVAIALPRSFEQVTAILGAWKAGAAFLPLDPNWPEARLSAVLAEAQPDALVAWQAPADHPALALIAPDAAGEPTAHATSPDDLAYVIYTSGSTGTPKGVEITHANLAALVDWHLAAFAITMQDRATHLAGLGFDAAVWEVWPYLAAGASVSLVEDAARTSGTLLQAALVRDGITVAFAPTALADELVGLSWAPDAQLRLLLTGADRLLSRPPAGLPFALVNNYGPTECTVVATSGVIAPGTDRELPPIGLPIAGATIRILDGEGAPVAPGEVGEIHIGGALVGRGYRGRPDLTAERFVSIEGERLYRTGDRGAWLADGQIAYNGRKDDQVKVRGHRIEPEEVAAVLRRHPALAAATVGAQREAGDTRLVGYVVPGAVPLPDAETLSAWMGERLPDYMVPSAWVRLDVLPLTANGKIDRRALPAPEAGNALAAAGFVAPETPAQARLADILQEVLGRGPVGLDDNFFLLGGHSLLGTQVVLRAGAAFGVELTLRHLFLAPTIRQLAALIETLVLEMIAAMDEGEARRAASA